MTAAGRIATAMTAAMTAAMITAAQSAIVLTVDMIAIVAIIETLATHAVSKEDISIEGYTISYKHPSVHLNDKDFTPP